MKKISILLKESVWDYMKDNVKLIIGNVVTLFIAIAPNFLKQANSVELTIKLPIIVSFIFILFLFVINIIALSKKYNILKKDHEELLNPSNENVKKFQQGDIVILRIEMDLKNPRKLVVSKILKSEIICRNGSNELINYSPEELLTKEETCQVFQKIKTETQILQMKNVEFWDSINK